MIVLARTAVTIAFVYTGRASETGQINRGVGCSRKNQNEPYHRENPIRTFDRTRELAR